MYATYFYVDIATTGPANSGDFANIYIGGAKFGDAVIIKVTNDRVTSTAGGPYHSLVGTGFTYSSTGAPATGYDISFALPISFLENDPDHIGFISPGNTLGVGDQVRVSGSQSYGYTYAGGIVISVVIAWDIKPFQRLPPACPSPPDGL